MKFRYTIVLFLIAATSIAAQTVRNSLLEYATGTWCSSCACSHQEVYDSIVPNFPNTIVIAYHAGSADPFSTFTGDDIVQTLGYGGLPGGIVDRVTSVMGLTHWYDAVDDMANNSPGVSLNLQTNFDETTRTFDVALNITALTDLNEPHNVQLVITEDSLIADQAGSEFCPGGDEFVHNNVARMMLNGVEGEQINNGNNISNGTVIPYTKSFELDEGLVYKNCKLVAFVYRYSLPLSKAYVQQTTLARVIEPEVPVEFGVLSATVSNNLVNLKWNTHSELNNSGFILARKTDAGFGNMKFVKGMGTTTKPNQYMFQDEIKGYSGSVIYRLYQQDFDGTITMLEELNVEVNAPEEFQLTQNFPNPFNPETVIRFGLPFSTKVNLEVYDILGNRIITLVNRKLEAGIHDVKFNGSALTSGVYIYKLTTESGTLSRKMTILK